MGQPLSPPTLLPTTMMHVSLATRRVPERFVIAIDDKNPVWQGGVSGHHLGGRHRLNHSRPVLVVAAPGARTGTETRTGWVV